MKFGGREIFFFFELTTLLKTRPSVDQRGRENLRAGYNAFAGPALAPPHPGMSSLWGAPPFPPLSLSPPLVWGTQDKGVCSGPPLHWEGEGEGPSSSSSTQNSIPCGASHGHGEKKRPHWTWHTPREQEASWTRNGLSQTNQQFLQKMLAVFVEKNLCSSELSFSHTKIETRNAPFLDHIGFSRNEDSIKDGSVPGDFRTSKSKKSSVLLTRVTTGPKSRSTWRTSCLYVCNWSRNDSKFAWRPPNDEP